MTGQPPTPDGGDPKVYDKGFAPAAKSMNSVRVEEMIKAMDVGAVLTWEEFIDACDTDLDGVRKIVARARGRLEKQGYFTETVVGIGVQRIDANEAVEREVPKRLNTLRRGARRVKRIGRAINVDELNGVNAIRHLGSLQVAEMVEASADKRVVDKLGSAAKAKGNGSIPELAAQFQEMVDMRKGG